MSLGKKIFEQRKKASLSQEELAHQLHVTRQSVSLWETDQSVPSMDYLVHLSMIFHISLDELCGKESIKKVEKIDEKVVLEKSDSILAKGELKYTRDILNRAGKYGARKILRIDIACFFAFLFLAICLLLSKKTEYYYAIILVIIGIAFLVNYFVYLKRIQHRDEQLLKAKPDLVLHYTFYNSQMEIELISKNSREHYIKKYFEITGAYKDNQYIYIIFNERLFVIDTKTLDGQKGDVLRLLRLDLMSQPANHSSIKTLLIIMFILSLVSIFGALFTLVTVIESSPLPRFPDTSMEYMWLFFLFVPLSLASITLGIVFLKKGYKCKKNIIGGLIMTFILSAFGSFTFIFGNAISHDMAYLSAMESRLPMDLPNEGYISIEQFKNGNIKSFAMAKFTDKNQMDNVIAATAEGWHDNQSFVSLSQIISPFYRALTARYDNFCLYDIDKENYYVANDETINNHEFYYLAYSEKDAVLSILNFFYINPSVLLSSVL